MVNLYNDDCLTVFNNIPDCSCDLAIIDPPYKLNKTTGGTSKGQFSYKWAGNIKCADKCAGIVNDIEFSKWLPQIYRVLKANASLYIWTNDKNLADLQYEAEKVGFKLHNILVWKKNNCTPNRWYMKNCEFILFLYKGKAYPITNLGCSQFFSENNISGKKKHHPTEKPIGILSTLIKNSSKEGEVILDCFMGSGSTGVACKLLNRNFIGIEIDDKYFNIAQERINKADEEGAEK